MIYDGSGGSLDNLESVVRKTTKVLREHIDEFDSIAVTGTSGLLVGVPAAMRLKKPIVIVRKEEDGSHDYRTVINAQNMGRRVLFLDDLVATGDTRQRVVDAVAHKVPRYQSARVVAQYEYHSGLNGWSVPSEDELTPNPPEPPFRTR